MTPIEETRNIGPITAQELRSVGIATREKLLELGWEAALLRLVSVYPERINLNMAKGLIGACDDVDWRAISPAKYAEAKALIASLRRAAR